MSEDSAGPFASDAADNSGFTPPATQDELNKIVADRLTRERAKYADYDDLKSKAAKFDEIEEANRSELERAQQAAADAAAKLSKAEKVLLRQKVALEKGLPAKWVSRLAGDTEEELSADADSILADLSSSDKAAGPYVPGEGHSPSALPLNGDGLEDSLRRKLGI